jgi:surfeit locus 1 family protein
VYRFALRPVWLLSHLLVVALVAACIAAGFWQLSRLGDKRDAIDRFEERGAEPVVPVEELVAPDADAAAIDAVELRPVTVTGTYLPDEQVTVANRTYDGAPGYWVLTPVALDDGTGVVVNRGWVPLSVGESAEGLATVAPLAGGVTVTGTIAATQTQGRFGATDSAEGHLDEMARADIARIDAQTGIDLLPAYVTLDTQDPAQATDLPAAVEPVPPDEGPHLGYAFQWFIFATIAVVGYPLVLRKVARDKESERRAIAAGVAPPEGRRRRSSKVPVDD